MASPPPFDPPPPSLPVEPLPAVEAPATAQEPAPAVELPGAALPVPPPAPEPTPWGPVLTVVLAFAVLFAYAVVQTLPFLFALTTPAAASGPGVPPTPPSASTFGLPALPNAGFLFALGTLLGAPLGIAMVYLLARTRRGLPARRYLALRRPGVRDTLLALALLALFNFAYSAVSERLGRPEVPDFMIEAFRTAVFLPALWLAVVVAAPVFEELLFRGFLIEGLRRSRAGAVGAALVSSVLFAFIHLQYDLFDMAAIFGLGLLFAVMRLKSGSTWLVIGLHALSNLVSMVQVTWYLRQQG